MAWTTCFDSIRPFCQRAERPSSSLYNPLIIHTKLTDQRDDPVVIVSQNCTGNGDGRYTEDNNPYTASWGTIPPLKCAIFDGIS